VRCCDFKSPTPPVTGFNNVGPVSNSATPFLMAGGGMKTGQAIGASDRIGGHATKRPVTHQEIFATIYKNLGIDGGSIREYDNNGRPHYPIDGDAQPLRELV